MDIFLHLLRRKGEIARIKCLGDGVEVAAAEVEGEADEGVELVLVELFFLGG